MSCLFLRWDNGCHHFGTVFARFVKLKRGHGCNDLQGGLPTEPMKLGPCSGSRSILPSFGGEPTMRRAGAKHTASVQASGGAVRCTDGYQPRLVAWCRRGGPHRSRGKGGRIKKCMSCVSHVVHEIHATCVRATCARCHLVKTCHVSCLWSSMNMCVPPVLASLPRCAMA